MVESNLETELAFVRANLLGELLQPRAKKTLSAIGETWKKALQEHAQEISRIIRQWENKFGRRYPYSDPDEIGRLALAAGIPKKFIENARWKPDDIGKIIEFHLLDRKDNRKPGGRPSNRDMLWKIMQDNPGKSDKEIVTLYHHKYSRRERITTKTVRDTRYNYTHRKQNLKKR